LIVASLFWFRTFAHGDALVTVLPEYLCDHVFRLGPQNGLDGRPAPSKKGAAVIVDSPTTTLALMGDAFLHALVSINLGTVLATSFGGGST
jgi:hypothetical protein